MSKCRYYNSIHEFGTTPTTEALDFGFKPPNKKKQKKKDKNKGALLPQGQTNKNQKEKGQAQKQYTWETQDTNADQFQPQKVWKDICAHYGLEGYWSKRCRTLKYHAELHQAILIKKMEPNLATTPPVDAPPQYIAEDFEDDDMCRFYLLLTFILQSFSFGYGVITFDY